MNIILILGATQGLLLSALIFQKHRKLYANHFLSLLMFLYSIMLVQMLLTDLGFDKKYPQFLYAFLGFSFLIGPLHYLYAKSLIRFSALMKKLDWLHFIPFLFVQIYFLSFMFKTKKEALSVYDNQPLFDEALLFLIYNWLIILQAMIYLILTILLINRYSKNIKNVFSTIEKIKLTWLKIITFAVIFVLSLFLIENLLMLFSIRVSHHFNLTSLIYATLIYVLGYIGLSKSEIFSAPNLAKSMSQMQSQNALQKEQAPPRYEKSGLNPRKAKEYVNALLKLMETEKPYQNSELTLPQLAEKLAISPHNLSEVINTQLKQNFFDFINQYRVEEVKQAFSAPDKQHLKILAIAFDAGFNSKTSFNTIFKKEVGVTPSEFRKKCLVLN